MKIVVLIVRLLLGLVFFVFVATTEKGTPDAKFRAIRSTFFGVAYDPKEPSKPSSIVRKCP